MHRPSTQPSASANPPAGRVFRTSFEAVSDFKGFYIVPQNHMGTASHDITTEQVHSGRYSHKGWVFKENPPPSLFHGDNNHRGYPTVQLHKLPGGGFRTPCLVDFWVWLDMTIKPGQWFSLATFSADPTDRWRRVVLLNVGHEGWPHFMHVPGHQRKDWTYQNKRVVFPMREWVHFRVYLDFNPAKGHVKAWMNGQLVSEARFEGGTGRLEQAHFGLYAPASVSRATVFNDDLVIEEGVPEQAAEGAPPAL